jgi:hypothetical protein
MHRHLVFPLRLQIFKSIGLESWKEREIEVEWNSLFEKIYACKMLSRERNGKDVNQELTKISRPHCNYVVLSSSVYQILKKDDSHDYETYKRFGSVSL